VADDPYTIAGRPFVGIQVGAASFVDEGTDAVLDLFRERAGINAVLLASHTFDRGTGGRQIAGHPLPDHGAPEYDPQFRGGALPRSTRSSTARPPSATSARRTTLTWTSSRR